MIPFKNDSLILTNENGELSRLPILSIPPSSEFSFDSFQDRAKKLELTERQTPLLPDVLLSKASSIIEWKLLNDKTRVLYKMQDGSLNVVDLLTSETTKSPSSSFDEVLEQINPQIWISSWCTIDSKLGVLFSSQFSFSLFR